MLENEIVHISADIEMVFDFIEQADCFVISLGGVKLNLCDAGIGNKDLVQQLRDGLDIYNSDGVKVLEKVGHCWCCGQIRYRLAEDAEENDPTSCMGKRIAARCKYVETKKCKPDGNCKGKDFFHELRKRNHHGGLPGGTEGRPRQ